MFGIELFSITFAVGAAVGAIGLWVLQNGWGKALAIYHARTAAAAAQVKTLYDEVSGQVNAIVGPVKREVDALKARVAALEPKSPAQG